MSDTRFHEMKEGSGACADCGNSPVNHLETYLLHSLSAWMGSGRAPRVGRPSAMMRWLEVLVESIGVALVHGLMMLRIARFGTDSKRASTYRSEVIWDEAKRRGIEMQQLILIGSHTEIYRARLGGAWIYFQSIPVPPRFIGDRSWIDDKYALKHALEGAGVPVPQVRSVTSERSAAEAFAEMGAPVVIKPQVGSRARHTVVNVRSEVGAREGFRVARKLCRYVAVERYLEGSVCRATYVDGVLRGFFQGDAPRVIGDGVSTIRQLVHAANSTKPDRVGEILLSDEHERFLARAGYTLDSVPEAGMIIPLTHRTGRLFGGRTRELLGSEHPKLKSYLDRAAAALAVPIVGFDLIIKDPEADPDAQMWGIIEANSLPYIDLHYLPLEGKASNVAAAVWDLWEKPQG